MNHISIFLSFVVIFATNYVSALDSEGIIGGDEAVEGQFPYQISLQINNKPYCGGAILSENFVLTAAHCVIDSKLQFYNKPYRVVANTLNNKIRPVDVAVDSIYVPNNYNPKKDINDIALLKLKTPLGLKKNPLRAIKLPSANKTYAGVKAVISGYGWDKIEVKNNEETGELISKSGSSAGQLKYAAVNVITNDECEMKDFLNGLPKTAICGQVVQRGKNGKYEGICAGDSGGPLVYNDVVIGVVSVSPKGCDESFEAAIYTRVSSYLPFINHVMSGDINSSILVHKIS